MGENCKQNILILKSTRMQAEDLTHWVLGIRAASQAGLPGATESNSLSEKLHALGLHGEQGTR